MAIVRVVLAPRNEYIFEHISYRLNFCFFFCFFFFQKDVIGIVVTVVVMCEILGA